MIKNHLKLVCVNPNPPSKNALRKAVNWFCSPRMLTFTLPLMPWQKTQEEKIAILKDVLTQAFADYDYTTEEVNIYPAIRAEEAVRKMIENKTLDYYFKRHKLRRAHLAKSDKIEAKFKRRKV